jgi:phage terminase small subunit
MSSLNDDDPAELPLRARKQLLMRPREEAFINEMVRDPNSPAAAAIRAGWPAMVAGPTASSLLQRTDIVTAISEGRAEVQRIVTQQTGLDLARVVGILAELLEFNPAQCYDEDGKLLPIHEMPRGAQMAIEGIESEELFEGRGRDRERIGEVKKLKWSKRLTAIDMAMRHLGGYELDNRQKSDPIVELLRELSGGRSNTLRISDE